MCSTPMSTPAGSLSTIAICKNVNISRDLKDPISANVYQTLISAVVYVTYFILGSKNPTHHPIYYLLFTFTIVLMFITVFVVFFCTAAYTLLILEPCFTGFQS